MKEAVRIPQDCVRHDVMFPERASSRAAKFDGAPGPVDIFPAVRRPQLVTSRSGKTPG